MRPRLIAVDDVPHVGGIGRIPLASMRPRLIAVDDLVHAKPIQDKTKQLQ